MKYSYGVPMKRLSIVVFLFIALFTPLSANAFGPSAHKVIVRIAYNNLTEEATRAVDSIISVEMDFDDRNLERAATWADRVRGHDSYDYLSKLHFTNLPKWAESYVKERDCLSGSCLTEAASEYLKILGDETYSPTERLVALKLVMHFVADLHQPLHLGLFEDRGGNLIKVRFRGEATNLHRVWDSRLVRVRMGKKGVNRYADELSARARRPVWSGDNGCEGDDIFRDWTEESRSIAMKHAYRVDGLDASGLRGGHSNSGRIDLSEGYILRSARIAEERLMTAGRRLACVLNRAFPEAGEKR